MDPRDLRHPLRRQRQMCLRNRHIYVYIYIFFKYICKYIYLFLVGGGYSRSRSRGERRTSTRQRRVPVRTCSRHHWPGESWATCSRHYHSLQSGNTATALGRDSHRSKSADKLPLKHAIRAVGTRELARRDALGGKSILTKQ